MDDSIEHIAADVPSEINFGRVEQEMLEIYSGVPQRHLYYYLLNIVEHPEVLPTAMEIVKNHLNHTVTATSHLPDELSFFGFSHEDFANRLATIRRWRVERLDVVSSELGKLNKDQCADLLLQYAPTALLDGCWLQNASTTSTSNISCSSLSWPGSSSSRPVSRMKWTQPEPI